MGIIATVAETDSLLKQHPETPILFPEDRAFPIRLPHQLPVRWVKMDLPDHLQVLLYEMNIMSGRLEFGQLEKN